MKLEITYFNTGKQDTKKAELIDKRRETSAKTSVRKSSDSSKPSTESIRSSSGSQNRISRVPSRTSSKTRVTFLPLHF